MPARARDLQHDFACRKGVSLEDAVIRRIADMFGQPDIFAAATRIRAQAERAAAASGGVKGA